MRILFAGGGTGGHLYPGLAIARALRRLRPEVQPFFVGARRGVEKFVLPSTEFPHELLDVHPLYRARPWENWRTARGAFSAWRRLRAIVSADSPACVVGTGGYASAMALAYARTTRLPYVIQEQNSFPGITTRFFARGARQIHLGFREAAEHLRPGRTSIVFDSGNPVEPPPDPRPDRATARAAWGFPAEGGRVLLVYGGSQGSRAVNDVVAAWARRGIPEGIHVIWSTGRETHSAYADLESPQIRVRSYLSPVSDAYAAADFAVSRGGAIATAELCAWGIPPIIVPLPTAAADHQTANARALEVAGLAEVIRQSELTVDSLDLAVHRLAGDDMLLQSRTEAALRRARPHAADTIARHVLELVDRSRL